KRIVQRIKDFLR
nr:Chain A, Antibacterial protein LL-37 [Homo sapiens]